MLDLQTYGQYREFLLYATVLFGLLSLAIKDNLNYIVSVRPADAPIATTQTLLMLLATTTLGVACCIRPGSSSCPRRVSTSCCP